MPVGYDSNNTRQSVLDEAMVAVVSAGMHDTMLHVEAEATKLLSEHPDCEVSLAEMREYLMRYAVRVKVAMEIG